MTGRLALHGADRALTGLVGTAVYLGLHSAIPTAANEITDADFPRIEITAAEFGVQAGTTTQELVLQSEQAPTAPSADVGTATHIGFWSAATGGDLLWWDTISGALAIGTASLSGDAVDAVAISNGGSDFTAAPAVHFIGGGGSGAEGTAAIANGAVTAVTVDAGGSGYSSAPAVRFEGGNDISVVIASGTNLRIPALGLVVSLPLGN